MAFLVFLIAIASIAEAMKLAGPFDIVLNEIEPCDDVGTDEMTYALTAHKKDQRTYVYDGFIYFKYPLGQGIKGIVEVQKWTTFGWGRNAFRTVSKDECTSIQESAPGYFTSLCKAMGISLQCPIPPGNYSIKNWEVDIEIPLKVLPYGKYRAVASLFNGTKRVGCNSLIVEVVMKK